MHDGAAATETGFCYRIAYIDPSLIQAALAGDPLPFVAEPVVDASRLAEILKSGAWDFTVAIDDVTRVDIIGAITDLLKAVAPRSPGRAAPLALTRLSRVRDCIGANPAQRSSMDEFERLAGLDRWTLARQFRAAFGTSLSRFRTMRQLDHVRRLLRHGAPLAEAAIEAGFADQSHMTRHFKRAYGLTPGDWRKASTMGESGSAGSSANS